MARSSVYLFEQFDNTFLPTDWSLTGIGADYWYISETNNAGGTPTLGQLVKDFGETHDINVASLPNGLYICNLKEENAVPKIAESSSNIKTVRI